MIARRFATVQNFTLKEKVVLSVASTGRSDVLNADHGRIARFRMLENNRLEY
jgi:hypothetical protein